MKTKNFQIILAFLKVKKMVEILQYTMLLLVFYVVIRYIKNNNQTLSDLRSKEPKTEQEKEQIKQFKEIMEKEKNKIRY